ncbi:plasmid maintenance system antidote protein [Clostridium sulfidigenes]|uniref:Plasmid maintenance system antidote protein n=1 Tax=Clostridium sulfidigenes TaxID=318464 RepID=A0A084JHT2_9CLOT|nr:helix-turn-helix transcriptional regulator [Clostridium sulfidigenes]KEZ88516.1 plasmid maintenance system antidote protein [Clostridium sulfidigenes]
MLKLDIFKLRLSQARACLSVEELATKAEIARISLSRILNGESNATPKTIGKLAKALDVDVTELLKDEE